jgi:hypothetical protein
MIILALSILGGLLGVFVGDRARRVKGPALRWVGYLSAALLVFVVSAVVIRVALGLVSNPFGSGFIVGLVAGTLYGPRYEAKRVTKREANWSASADSLELSQPESPEMPAMRGWARLGVVLSMVWLLGVLAYTGYDYWSLQSSVSNSVVGRDGGVALDEWDVVSVSTALSTCNLQQIQPECSVHATRLAAWLFGPLVAIWISVVGVVATVRWVRAGFQGRR